MLGLFNPFDIYRVAIFRRNKVEEDAACTGCTKWVEGGGGDGDRYNRKRTWPNTYLSRWVGLT
jgi:hypothetical protein